MDDVLWGFRTVVFLVFVEVIFDSWEEAVLSFDLLEVVVEALPVLVVLVVWIVQRLPSLLPDHLKLYILNGGSVVEEVLNNVCWLLY